MCGHACRWEGRCAGEPVLMQILFWLFLFSLWSRKEGHKLRVRIGKEMLEVWERETYEILLWIYGEVNGQGSTTLLQGSTENLLEWSGVYSMSHQFTCVFFSIHSQLACRLEQAWSCIWSWWLGSARKGQWGKRWSRKIRVCERKRLQSLSKESKLYKEVRIWGTKGRTDEWEVPVGSGVVAIRELQKYNVVVKEWDAWNWDYGKVIICNDKVKSVTIEVNSYVRVEDRSWDSQGIETQGVGRIIYFNTEMTRNCDEGKTKRVLASQWLKSVRNWRWQPRLSGSP